ncbi:unnamed protein product, partial [Ectocarpus sp. 12 AP-2014]
MASGNGFPYILHDLLKNEASAIVTWTSTGTAFGILDNAAFGQDVLSSYFKHNKFSSFQRQLNLYGFRKIVKGRESGCYMHPMFLRDRPDLLSEVRRGVVPPCPPEYTRKVYGSGPRFMNQDDETDSEPELVIPSRGNRDRSPEVPSPGMGSAVALAGRAPPGASIRPGDIHHLNPYAGGGDHHHQPAYLRGMAPSQDRTGAGGAMGGGAAAHLPHRGVLSGAGGGYGGAMGMEDNGWSRARSGGGGGSAGAGGAGGGGGGFYRGGMDGGVPAGIAYQQQPPHHHHHQLQQQYQLQQHQLQQHHHQQGQYLHRQGMPDGGGGGATWGAAGVGGGGGEDGLLVESPGGPPLGRFLDGMDSPVVDG